MRAARRTASTTARSIGASSAYTQGGDWETSSLHLVGQSIEPKITSKNLLRRASSFDVTDNINVFLQSNWYENSNQSHAYPNEFFGGLNIAVDNAFLPAAIRAQLQAAGAQFVTMGTSNLDMGTVTIDTDRRLVRNVVGAEGRFAAFDTNWTWNAYFQGGVSKSRESAFNSLNLVKHALAVDAVVDSVGRDRVPLVAHQSEQRLYSVQPVRHRGELAGRAQLRARPAAA